MYPRFLCSEGSDKILDRALQAPAGCYKNRSIFIKERKDLLNEQGKYSSPQIIRFFVRNRKWIDFFKGQGAWRENGWRLLPKGKFVLDSLQR